MNVDCYISKKCSSEDDLRKNLQEALRLENVEAKLNIFIINDEKANELGLKGSPSIFINGKEIQPIDIIGFS
ncbi:MAG: hypothetical protein HXY47_04130 [Nitrospirae bacterium]|nr:hypothetical protein [Nitrospirota bacterium]